MEYQLPELGEGIYEAELVEWRVQPGQAVRRGETLAEVLTDKATIELPSPFAGKILQLQIEAGSTMKIGQAILSYEPGKSDKRTGAAAPDNSAADARSRSKPRDAAEEAVSVAAADSVPSQHAPSSAPAGDSAEGLRVKAGPAVRRMASLMGVDLRHLHGTGPEGRILVADLKNVSPDARDIAPEAEDDAASRPAAGPATSLPRSEKARPQGVRPGSRIKFLGIRRKIAEHMVASKQAIPHFGYVDECDVTDLVRLRASLNQSPPAGSVKLTYLPFFVRAVVIALKEVPLVNATLDEQAQEIVLHDHYAIGIATATPDGLVVPVVHDADRKGVIEIAKEIQSLAEAARLGTLAPRQLRGGTFTISSIGNIGGLTSMPIIHRPQVGILGIGRIVKRPMYDSEEHLRAADMVYLSFAFDHRVVDGAVGAEFSNVIIRELQNPARLLLNEAS